MRGLSVELVWFDESVIELALIASNGRYEAKSNFYVSIDELDALAERFVGFPQAPSDVREFEFSTPDLPGYGGATIGVTPRDVRGRVLVSVDVFTKKQDEFGDIDSASIHFSANLSDVDSFVLGMKMINKQLHGTACLPADL